MTSKFIYQDLFPISKDETVYRKLSGDYVRLERLGSEEILKVDPKALTLLTQEAFKDINFLFRTSHLEQLALILDDPEASFNDRFVAFTQLKNAAESAKGILPSCQDTGTAIVVAKKGDHVWTDGKDEESLSRGIYEAYQNQNLRYSQLTPLSMFEEKNTGTGQKENSLLCSIPLI